MKTTKLLKGFDLSFKNLPLEPTPENIQIAGEFAFRMWKDRWKGLKHKWEADFGRPYPHDEPEDLSSSCKFTSIFAALVFDAEIDGNYDHQFAVKDGSIMDLNSGAADVSQMAKPYAIWLKGPRDFLLTLKGQASHSTDGHGRRQGEGVCH